MDQRKQINVKLNRNTWGSQEKKHLRSARLLLKY